jgi:hypothetical protein
MSGAGPIDWDATLGGDRDVPQPTATELTEPQPWIVTPDEAAAFAEDTGWCVFPARVRVDEARGKVEKLPAVAGSWNEVSSNNAADVKAMWDDRPQLIAVDCRKSGLVVFDADSLPIEDGWWRDLTSTGTHVRRSVSGRGLHVFFTAPAEWDATTPVPGTWPYGEVKYRGYVVLSNLPVVTPAEVRRLPDPIRDRMRDEHRRESGPGGRAGSYGSRELTLAELDEWLDEEQVLETGAPEVFLGRVVDRLRDKVRSGTARRTATFSEVHVAAIESCAGLYGRRAAHDALLEAYRLMHDDDEWHRRRRELGYRRMWTYLAGADVAGSDAWTDVVAVARSERGLPSHEEAGQFEAWLEARRAGEAAPSSPPADAGSVSTGRAEAESGTPPPSASAPPATGDDEVPTATEPLLGVVTPPEEIGTEGEIPTSEPGVGESDGEGETQPTAEELAAFIDSRVDMLRVRDEIVRLRHQQLARQKFDEMESAHQAALHGSRHIPIDLEGELPELTPLDVLVKDDGDGIASSQQHVHLIAGKNGTGKSFLVQYLLIEQARRGRRVAYLDWEMNARDVTRRLQTMGAKRELNDCFSYFNMSGVPLGSQLDEVLLWKPDIVIVDSVSKAMGAEDDAPEGYENSPSFFLSWISRAERVRAHASLFLIDHVGHANQHRPRGASSKMDQVDFAYSVAVAKPWSREEAGSALITARKSRAGELKQDDPVAEMRITPSHHGASVDVYLTVPSASAALTVAARTETAADAGVRSEIMALMADGECRSKKVLKSEVKGGNDRIGEQVDRLVAEGVLEDLGTKGFRARRLGE